MYALFTLLDAVISIYIWIIIASVIYSWLISFGIINQQSQFVRLVGEFLYRATEPVLAPIRKILPNLGALDFSPIVLVLLLYFIRNLIIVDLGRQLM